MYTTMDAEAKTDKSKLNKNRFRRWSVLSIALHPPRTHTKKKLKTTAYGLLQVCFCHKIKKKKVKLFRIFIQSTNQ